jgi:hypothetical protein
MYSSTTAARIFFFLSLMLILALTLPDCWHSLFTSANIPSPALLVKHPLSLLPRIHILVMNIRFEKKPEKSSPDLFTNVRGGSKIFSVSFRRRPDANL